MIVKNVNLAKVRKALRYERVREVVYDDLLRYEIDALNPDWPGAYLVLGRDCGFGKRDVLQAGFGEWHEHFEQYQNPDRNVAAALAFLAEVVAGKLCLIAGYDQQGRYSGGSLRQASAVGPNAVQVDLGGGKAVSFKSYRFNQAPECQVGCG